MFGIPLEVMYFSCIFVPFFFVTSKSSELFRLIHPHTKATLSSTKLMGLGNDNDDDTYE